MNHVFVINNATRKEYDVPCTILVGRSPDCDIRILEPSISRYHIYFSIFHDDTCFIGDGNPVNGQGSRNGFLLKGKVYKRENTKVAFVELFGGEKIQIGANTTIEYIKFREEEEDSDATLEME